MSLKHIDFLERSNEQDRRSGRAGRETEERFRNIFARCRGCPRLDNGAQGDILAECRTDFLRLFVAMKNDADRWFNRRWAEQSRQLREMPEAARVALAEQVKRELAEREKRMTSSIPQPELRVDTSGRYCPVPILELARGIQQVPAGSVVEVIATDPGVETDVPSWCKATGHALLGLACESGTWRALVRKK